MVLDGLDESLIKDVFKSLVAQGMDGETAAQIAYEQALKARAVPQDNEAKTLYFPSSYPEFGGAAPIKPLNGCIYVEMFPPRESGAILLPETVAERLWPDAGHVVAAPDGGDARVGDVALVLPFAGTWYEDAEFGRPFRQLRVYGIHSKSENQLVHRPYWKSVPGCLRGGKVQAYGRMVFIKRDPVTDTESGLALTKSQTYRGPFATVISAGGECTEVKPGDRVVVHSRALILDTRFAEEMEDGDDPMSYAFIDERNISGILE